MSEKKMAMPGERFASVWDLDGTLLSTDVFAESVMRIALRCPWRLFAMPWWLLKSRAYCKGRVAEVAAGLWNDWPVREVVLKRIIASREAGDMVVLATGAHERVATAVARHVGLFDAVLASTDTINLKGSRKLTAIQTLLEQSQCTGFSYAGDCCADLPIWAEADQRIAVAPAAGVLRALSVADRPFEVLESRGNLSSAMFKALRPHQWAKNLLLFVPLVAAHRFDLSTVINTCLAFAAFCMVASAVYVLNDLSDLESDRRHPIKHRRPFASGRVSITMGILLVGLLLVGGVTIAQVLLTPTFVAVLIGYFASNILYSAYLKRRPIIDVLMLALMYVLRIEAGGIAGPIPLSQWLLAFALFIFTSLALAKRYAELRRIQESGGDVAAGRGYVVADCELLLAGGMASGYVAVLVLVLYMNSEQMRAVYGESRLLWVLCPLIMYWITRVWLIARRGGLNEDPLIFAFKDKASLAISVACAAVVAVAAMIR